LSFPILPWFRWLPPRRILELPFEVAEHVGSSEHQRRVILRQHTFAEVLMRQVGKLSATDSKVVSVDT